MPDDEYIEKGATIHQMENVFKHFNIPVRLYNFRNEIIYRHDPEARTREKNCNIQCFSEKQPHIHIKFLILKVYIGKTRLRNAILHHTTTTSMIERNLLDIWHLMI